MRAVSTAPASHPSAPPLQKEITADHYFVVNDPPRATLKEWGFLTNGGDRIGVTRGGPLQIDRLLHEFSKPEHKTGRYA